MEATLDKKTQQITMAGSTEKGTKTNIKTDELFKGIHAALETYSNVHRGSGHNSMVTSHLYDEAREIVLNYLGMGKSSNTVFFCSARRAEKFMKQLGAKDYKALTGKDTGLNLGITALVVKKRSLKKLKSFETGGGTAKLISKKWIIWAGKPGKYEAGTPAIVNVIAFARALQMLQKYGKDVFRSVSANLSPEDILHDDKLKDFSGKVLLDKLKETLVGRNKMVPTAKGNRPFVNFDNAASTPTLEPIWNTFKNTLQQPEEIQQQIVNEVKSICATSLDATRDQYEVIFTSNTTESVNMVAESFQKSESTDNEMVVLNSLLEHTSNEIPWRMAKGASLVRCEVDEKGFVDLNDMEKILSSYNKKKEHGKKKVMLVAISSASNVLGTRNKLKEISSMVHQHGAELLVDAAQLVAHQKIDMAACGIDYLAFSAHKMYAPFGTGVLLARKGLLNFSEKEMETIQLSGENNPAGIAALGKSLLLFQRVGMDVIKEEELELTAYLLEKLETVPGIEIFGVRDPSSEAFSLKVGLVPFYIKNKTSSSVGRKLANQAGIGIRTGCHCAHLIVKRIAKVPPWTENLQWLIQHLFPKIELPGVARVSFGIYNNKNEVDMLIAELHKIAADKGIFGKRDPAMKQKSKDFTEACGREVY
jgi:selenocysteine lyase/cysteine desulfurase